jgi:hypothetical protein
MLDRRCSIICGTDVRRQPAATSFLNTPPRFNHSRRPLPSPKSSNACFRRLTSSVALQEHICFVIRRPHRWSVAARVSRKSLMSSAINHCRPSAFTPSSIWRRSRRWLCPGREARNEQRWSATQPDSYLAIREALGFRMHANRILLKDFVEYLCAHNLSGPIRAQMGVSLTCQRNALFQSHVVRFSLA